MKKDWFSAREGDSCPVGICGGTLRLTPGEIERTGDLSIYAIVSLPYLACDHMNHTLLGVFEFLHEEARKFGIPNIGIKEVELHFKGET